MTGSELRRLLEESNLTLKELSEKLDFEPDRLRNLMKLGNQKLPITAIGRVRKTLNNLLE